MPITVTDYTSLNPSFYLAGSGGLLVMAGGQFMVFGIDNSNQNHWQIFNNDVDSVVYTSNFVGSFAYNLLSVDTDGFLYAMNPTIGQVVGRVLNINPDTVINPGGHNTAGSSYPLPSGTKIWNEGDNESRLEAGNTTIVDVGGHKYTLFQTAGTAPSGGLIGGFIRQGESDWASPGPPLTGCVYTLPLGQQADQGNSSVAFVSRPSDGRLYILSPDSVGNAGNWWLTSAPLPLNSGSPTPVNPDWSFKVSLSGDAVKPAMVNGYPASMVYSPADDAIIILMTDGSFAKITGLLGTGVKTIYTPVIANTVILNDTARLMYECSGAPDSGKGLADSGSFLISYIKSGHVMIGWVTVANMVEQDAVDLATVGIAALQSYFSTSIVSNGIYLGGVAFNSVNNELFLYPNYQSSGSQGGTHMESIHPLPPPITIFGISGNIALPCGLFATVDLTGPVITSTVADGSGNYSFAGLPAGTYTITPVGGIFIPSFLTVTLGPDDTSANFTCAVTFTISGTVSPTHLVNNFIDLTGNLELGYVVFNLKGYGNSIPRVAGTGLIVPLHTKTKFATAMNVVLVGNDKITPAGTFYEIQIFNPESPLIPVAQSTFHLVEPSLITVSLTGHAVASTTPDANGNYSFPGLLSGTYTVTPTATDFRTFAPTHRTVTIFGDTPGINFQTNVSISDVIGEI